MPAYRNRGSRRSDHDSDASTMSRTPPIEPFYPNGVSFATDIPVAFDAMHSESIFPANSHSAASHNVERSSPSHFPGPLHGRKKPENHVRRPANCFVLFRADFIKNHVVTSEVETSHSTLSQIIGLAWKRLPDAERQIWYDKAQVVLEQHNLQYPEYSYKPRAKGKSPKKRKVREVSPTDHKRCKRIAELLIEGKKGQELSEAVQEFDKHHVPDTIIRFDTPVTTQTYLRSSSAPVLYTDDSIPSTSSPRKTRSSSSQPPPRGSYDTNIPTSDFCPTTAFGLPAHPSFQPPSLEFDTFYIPHPSPPVPRYLCETPSTQDVAIYTASPSLPIHATSSEYFSNDWTRSSYSMSGDDISFSGMSNVPAGYSPATPSSPPFESGSGVDIDALVASFVPFSWDSILDASTYESHNMHADRPFDIPEYPLFDQNQDPQVDYTANLETFLTDFPRFPESP